MNYLSIFSPLVLASLLAASAHAETYGQAVQDESEPARQIKTVPRSQPAPKASTAAPAPDNAAQRIDALETGLLEKIKTAPRNVPPQEVAPATASASAAGVEVKPINVERWHLSAGHLISQELSDWGKRSGWKVLWRLPHSPTVPADTDVPGEDFKEAASDVIKTLADNGLVIRGHFYDSNRTLLVFGAAPVTLDPQ